jgi:hypothetical protein
MKNQKGVLINPAKWNLVATLARADLPIDEATLIELGHSIRSSRPFLVAMKRAGYLERIGKRGNGFGYKYLTTPKFWEQYEGSAMCLKLRQTAAFLKHGGWSEVTAVYQESAF